MKGMFGRFFGGPFGAVQSPNEWVTTEGCAIIETSALRHFGSATWRTGTSPRRVRRDVLLLNRSHDE